MELKLDLNITKEDVNTTIEARQIRVNELSISISNAYVKRFTNQLIVYKILFRVYIYFISVVMKVFNYAEEKIFKIG